MLGRNSGSNSSLLGSAAIHHTFPEVIFLLLCKMLVLAHAFMDVFNLPSKQSKGNRTRDLEVRVGEVLLRINIPVASYLFGNHTFKLLRMVFKNASFLTPCELLLHYIIHIVRIR